MKIVVVGGSAAGPKAAAKARRMDQHAEITIVQEAPDLSMASCGYPYFVGGFFEDRNQLLCTPTGVVRDPKYYLNAKGISALTRTRVAAIHPDRHVVACRDLAEERDFEVTYDKLVIATGASSVIPPIPGHDLDGITTLQSMRDADYLRRIADEKQIKKAVVVGGGLIGVETCEALHLAGIEITLVEMMPQLLMFLDWEMAKVLENHIKSKAAIVITENPVAEFLGENGTLTGIKLRNGIELPCELAVVAVGVRPNGQLAREAGLKVTERGGIDVNTFMQTSDPDIYAVGPGDVSKRVAQAAMAIQGKLTVADLVNADLPYAPPYSPAIDNFIMTAHALENKMTGRMTGVTCREVHESPQRGETPYLLDVRGADEFEQMRLGIGEHLIPLGALRDRLGELPEDKDREVICYCKISLRGYEAASVLEAHGWTNVKVMEGGIMAWPVEREK